jgi:hypothetical protein
MLIIKTKHLFIKVWLNNIVGCTIAFKLSDCYSHLLAITILHCFILTIIFSIVIINFGSQWMFVMNVTSSCIKQLNRLATCTQCVPIFNSSIHHQVPNDHVENARAFHKTQKGIKINKNSFEIILMTLTVLCKIMDIIVKSYSLIVSE